MIINTGTIDRTLLLEAVAQQTVDRRAERAGSDHGWVTLSPIAQAHIKDSLLPLVTAVIKTLEQQTGFDVSNLQADIDNMLWASNGDNDE